MDRPRKSEDDSLCIFLGFSHRRCCWRSTVIRMNLGSILVLMILSAAGVSSSHMPDKYPIEVYHMLQERTQFGIGRDNRVRGTWGTWSSWNECSRSCGTGVQSQSRECIPLRRLLRRRSIISENDTSSVRPICIGTYKRYHTCNTQECPNFAEDLRAEQCAKYNAKTYKDRSYVWVPFVDAPNSCALNCRAVGERFYATLEPAVMDGTPCDAPNLRGRGSNGILTKRSGERWLCVAGQCKPVGCDGVVGSGVTMDACGVCGGQGKECRLFEGIFMEPNLPKGHQQVTMIPKGAMSLNISELRFSSNFLALKDSNGSYILNGPRSYSPSGTYKAAGTTLTYQRGDRNRMECILATGPLNESLHLEILSIELNSGVVYKYMLPIQEVPDSKAVIAPPLLIAGSNDRGNEIPSPDTHVTVRVPVTRISNRRTDLSPTRRNRNLHGERKEEVTHPPTTVIVGNKLKSKTMKKKKKKFAWKISGYSPCSKECGGGIRSTILECIRESSQTPVNDKRCRNVGKPNPPPLRCNDHPCSARWRVEQWSKCSVTCGEGIRTRKIECVQELNAKLTIPVAAGACIQPLDLNTTEACNLPPCPNTGPVAGPVVGPKLRHMLSQHDAPRWEVTVWGPCSTTCGRGIRNRTVTCITTGDPCSLANKPESEKACEITTCNAVTDMGHHSPWLYSEWSSKCSAECGNGLKIRRVACADGSELFCNPKERPDTEIPCFERGMNCDRAKWFIGPWTSCSVSCGDGMQHRDIACIARTNDEFVILSAKNCSDPKPATKQVCRNSACSPEWFTSNWSSCSVTCGIGVQTRLVQCIYEGISSINCSEITKPTTEQQCNMEPCKKEILGVNKPSKKVHEPSECVDKYPNCALVVKNGLCRIKYYKHSCCQCRQ